MIFKRILIITLVCVLLPVTGFATIKISGYFIAGDTCPAVQSIKKGTNPGNINVTKGMAYPVIGKNKPNATHYLIKVEGATPVQRWVPVTCGKLIIDCTEISSGTTPGVQPGGTDQPEYLLAVSWQPAFCETHRSKPECGEEDPGVYEATELNTPLDVLLKNAKDNKKGCDNVFIDKIGYDN